MKAEEEEDMVKAAGKMKKTRHQLVDKIKKERKQSLGQDLISLQEDLEKDNQSSPLQEILSLFSSVPDFQEIGEAFTTLNLFKKECEV